jgi:hypothetical protein
VPTTEERLDRAANRLLSALDTGKPIIALNGKHHSPLEADSFELGGFLNFSVNSFSSASRSASVAHSPSGVPHLGHTIRMVTPVFASTATALHLLH